MTTVACVLRSGGLYTPEWVWALKRGLARHVTEPHEFRVLSDLDCFGLHGLKLHYPWARWWAKLELFRPGLFSGPVVYLDLDTLVVGDIADLLRYDGPLALLSDFYRPRNGQSGVMAWTPGLQSNWLWENFVQDPGEMSTHYRGDGEYIHALAGLYSGAVYYRLQDLFPGQIVSYKVDAREGPPPGARLVCFHGNPKPHDPQCGWAHREWLRL